MSELLVGECRSQVETVAVHSIFNSGIEQVICAVVLLCMAVFFVWQGGKKKTTSVVYWYDFFAAIVLAGAGVMMLLGGNPWVKIIAPEAVAYKNLAEVCAGINITDQMREGVANMIVYDGVTQLIWAALLLIMAVPIAKWHSKCIAVFVVCAAVFVALVGDPLGIM